MSIPHTRLYHFTCTARLPWIVGAKELRLYRNQIGGLPSPDFLWATTSSQVDPAASGLEGYREHVAALVRLTLFSDDFEPWPTIIARLLPSATELMRRLEADARARGQAGFELWYARAEPLPLSRIIRAEAKTYPGSWQAIELPCLQHPSNTALRGIILDDKVYCSHRLEAPAGTCIAEIVSLADWPYYDCLTRQQTFNLKFERFSDEIWLAIRAVRDDWPDDVDWSKFRREIEGRGRMYWQMHQGRQMLMPSKMRKTIEGLLQQARKLQAGVNSLPKHILNRAPDLKPVEQWLQDWLFMYERLEGRFTFGFAGRSDYYRDMLCEWLLIEWVNTLGGELSFSRDQCEKPYGPLIDFLSITLKAILGRAPGPSGLAKIIDQYR